MQNWLAGQDIKATALAAIADATAVDPGWLLTGAGHMYAGLPPQPTAAATRARYLSGSYAKHTQVAVPHDQVDFDGYAILPRYDVTASAGEGALVSSEQVVEFLAFQKEWLRTNLRRSPENLLLIEARGDSMTPTIRDRDLLIVDTAEQGVADGAVHVIRMGENLVVKRLELRYDGSVVIHSDNTRYAPVPVGPSEAEGIHIVGQVVWQGGPVRS